MALRQVGVDSEPIRIYKATPTVVASNAIFLVAWLAGTTGYFLSILATTFAQCIRWLPFRIENNPLAPANVTERGPNRPLRLKPTVTRPSLSRENVERHIPFSLDSQTARNVQQLLPPGDNMTCTTASFSSGDSTLCSSPLSDLGDLPPLKNLPPLLLDPQVPEMPERIQVKRPTTANFSIKARNPFKFRRTSTSSTPSPVPMIGEIPPVCPSIDRFPASPTEQASRKPSLIKRINMKGRGACSVGMVAEPPSSAPTSPRPSPSSFRNPANASKRSASVDIPTQISNFPVLPSLQQGSPRRSLFSSFTKRPRTVSLSAAPARTQPYGPPYNCPLPTPQPRRSSGTRRSTTSTQTPMHTI